MKITKRIEDAKRTLDEAIAETEQVGEDIDNLPEDTPADKRDFLNDALKDVEAKRDQALEKYEREVSYQKAREAAASVLKSAGVEVGEEPKTYRKGGPHSYFKDLVATQAPQLGMWTPDAAERLARHGKELLTDSIEIRDVTSGQPGTASFIPPLYMGSEWIDEEVAGRQFADSCLPVPLSATGKQMDFPRVQVAPTAAVQAAEAGAVNEVDFDGETYSVPKVTIAGQNDLSIQGYEFADPGMDTVIMRELAKSYNSVLDFQLLAGSGTSGQHQGLRNVPAINTVAFASGNGAALVGKIYDAISQIATNAPGYMADAVVMHPRRAAWIASHRDANGSLLQQGELFLAQGRQASGFAGSVGGLGVIADANISTNLGAATNEDELYVYARDELLLAEGSLRARVLTEVLSGNLQVRLQLYAFSAFAGGRRPKTVARISGAGLVPPTFPST